MVPGQGAASGTRSQGSARVAADGGEPDAAPRASAAQRSSAEPGTALLPPGGGAGEKGRGAGGARCRHEDLRSRPGCSRCRGGERCCFGRLLCVEQHLRSHARFLKRSSPNCAPSDVSAAPLPRHPPPGPAFPPAASSLLSQVRGWEAAGGARSRRVPSAPALPPGDAFPRSALRDGQGTPTLTPSRVLETQIREPKETCFRGTLTDAQGSKHATSFSQAHFKYWIK